MHEALSGCVNGESAPVRAMPLADLGIVYDRGYPFAHSSKVQIQRGEPMTFPKPVATLRRSSA